MADIEKTINEIESWLNATDGIETEIELLQNPPPFFAIANALKLLKEQLPVKPLYITDKEWRFKRFVCRNCSLPLHYEFVNNGVNNAYCSRCGRKIAWDKVKAKRRRSKDGEQE